MEIIPYEEKQKPKIRIKLEKIEYMPGAHVMVVDEYGRREERGSLLYITPNGI